MTSPSSNQPTAPTVDNASLRDRAGDALETARERAIDAYDQARESAAEAGRKVGDQVAGSPLLALAGGLAAGAVIGALLPKSKLEQKYLGPVGERFNSAGRGAIDAAREAGAAKLSDLDITPDAGAGVVRRVIDGFGEAAKSSGQAAVGALKNG